MATLLKMDRISKRFGRVQANDAVTFEAQAGEIHALLGENGAGKTTLMNILYGLYRPDSGEIYLRDKKVDIRAPKASIDLGIGMVHQHFMLISPFTVAENVMLGLKSARAPFLDTKNTAFKCRELASQYDLNLDPDAPVWQLSVGAQQRVEIIKALYRGAELLVLDEPTSVLTPGETKEFFITLRSMAEQGHTVIFITHKLEEVMEISDRCTVLRDGAVVGTVNTSETTEAELARMMVGREVVFRVDKKSVELGEAILTVRDLSVFGEQGRLAVEELSLDLHDGEILGIAGVDGNGQSELAEAIIGVRKPESGHIYLGEKEITGASPKEILDQKVTHIPEDRMTMGLMAQFTVEENLILDAHTEEPFSTRPFSNGGPGWFLNGRAIMDHALKTIRDFNIKTPGPKAKSRLLSGGNLQKLLLARAMYHAPRLLVAIHPTRGLDVGATEFIRNRLLAEREAGRGILLISADLDEVLQLSDRLMVMYEGQVMGELPAKDVDLAELGLLMAGVKKVQE